MNDQTYRDGYAVIATRDGLLRRLSGGEYTFANFSGGVGLTRKDVGGLYAYIKDGLIAEMQADGYIGHGGRILRKGFAVLGGCDG